MEDVIEVYGRNLVTEIIGEWTFAEITFAAITGGTRPTGAQAKMIDALLTTFVDHGVTPSSLAARLTFLGSPEAMQAAIAAGLSGAGSRYLGTMQTAGEMLQAAILESGGARTPASLASDLVDDFIPQKKHVPGLGHPEHKSGDPRTPKLVEIAKATGCYGEHCELLFALCDAFTNRTGHSLPVNAAGLSGAIVVDMGLPPMAGRGLAIVSRAAGLVGTILSEIREPQAQKIWDDLRTHQV